MYNIVSNMFSTNQHGTFKGDLPYYCISEVIDKLGQMVFCTPKAFDKLDLIGCTLTCKY